MQATPPGMRWIPGGAPFTGDRYQRLPIGFRCVIRETAPVGERSPPTNVALNQQNRRERWLCGQDFVPPERG